MVTKEKNNKTTNSKEPNENHEQKLVDTFCEIASKKMIGFYKSNYKVKVHSKADIVFKAFFPTKRKNNIFYIEAKSEKSSNYSNNAYMFFGNILKYRKLAKEKKVKDVIYGVLFCCVDKGNQNIDGELIKKIRDYYLQSDWNDFGSRYNCKYIFFCDEDKKTLFYAKWNNFINEPKFYKI